MKVITEQWIASAHDDLLIIAKITDNETLTHQTAFHAQQAIEKTLKAVIEEFELGFIKTHSLETLFGKIKPFITIPFELSLIKQLDQLYIDARYPSDLGLLPDGKPSLEEASLFQSEAEQIFAFVENKLA